MTQIQIIAGWQASEQVEWPYEDFVEWHDVGFAVSGDGHKVVSGRVPTLFDAANGEHRFNSAASGVSPAFVETINGFPVLNYLGSTDGRGYLIDNEVFDGISAITIGCVYQITTATQQSIFSLSSVGSSTNFLLTFGTDGNSARIRVAAARDLATTPVSNPTTTSLSTGAWQAAFATVDWSLTANNLYVKNLINGNEATNSLAGTAGPIAVGSDVTSRIGARRDAASNYFLGRKAALIIVPGQALSGDTRARMESRLMAIYHQVSGL